MRAHMGNRVGLGIVGLIMALAGVGVLAARADHLGVRIIDLSFFVRNAWARPLAAAAAILIALLVTRWLAVALGWGRCGSRTGSGTAMLGVAMKGIEGISRIQVRLVRDKRMRVLVSLLPRADLHEVIGRLDGQAISRVRGAVDREEIPTLVRLHVRRR
ncbi:hypothetical protein [Planotetraspora mira]|jgi:hypothetical protein|uniref:Alkaline shock response membrane anchor protein AmaP n=1 Tax=Planotetraspora mira TaxID=58121 RepID=A0A8J3X8G2_9ACTN|nr:hypothetical protein [Planotetraspora mira]GII30934.1 hypothetical protein Pmi06nite_43760 [Planotetraspora mira]